MNLRDKRILELLIDENRPISEISDELGVDEVYVVKRAKELLSAKDVFSVLEQKQMLVYQLKSLYTKANHLLDTTIDSKTWPKAVESITKLIQTTYEIQVQQEESNERDLAEITQAQAAILIEVVQRAYNRARDLLAAEYPEFPTKELDAAFTEGLVQVHQQYTSNPQLDSK